MKLYTSKFETEIEVIVKLAWKKIPIIPISINVLYDPDERVSHFRPFRDFSRISILNTYLVTLTLLYYLPIRVMQVIKREAIKSDESNLSKSLSIGFGFFMGIIPLWGFQLLIGIPLTFFFKLNKVLFVAAANISIPPFIPFIIFFSYLIGAPFVENHAEITSLNSLTLESIHLNFVQYVVGAIILAVAALIGMVDFFWQQAEHTRKNRMSRKEVTDEAKQMEGDPHVKQQRRQRGYEIAMNQMLADVPTADVIIVNPQHFAVALKWNREKGSAPVCVAKGVDEIAAKIRESAAKYGVPIHRDPPTARALYSVVDLGEQIPSEQYRAVAAAIRFAEEMGKRNVRGKN